MCVSGSPHQVWPAPPQLSADSPTVEAAALTSVTSTLVFPNTRMAVSILMPHRRASRLSQMELSIYHQHPTTTNNPHSHSALPATPASHSILPTCSQVFRLLLGQVNPSYRRAFALTASPLPPFSERPSLATLRPDSPNPSLSLPLLLLSVRLEQCIIISSLRHRACFVCLPIIRWFHENRDCGCLIDNHISSYCSWCYQALSNYFVV